MSLTPDDGKEPEFYQLQTCEGYTLDVETSVVEQMGTLRDMLLLETSHSTEVIPLSKIQWWVLDIVVQWCRWVRDRSSMKKDSNRVKYFEGLLREGKDEVIFQLLLAANFLHVESLMKAATQYLADTISACNSVEEIRDRFDLPDDIPSDEFEIDP
ncbi:uncharacterized protein [Drosophila bipectinata]|uniref:uncharacterized protein n=1 Tax=Drosophila bipectinata TaxID=42026 RepID=UPI001C8930C7|nr:SKP1-like protein 14 [Drosophila bipectinata]KAH8252077.1 hypothetical protein KR026_002568 [Drosophila bipectinata]